MGPVRYSASAAVYLGAPRVVRAALTTLTRVRRPVRRGRGHRRGGRRSWCRWSVTRMRRRVRRRGGALRRGYREIIEADGLTTNTRRAARHRRRHFRLGDIGSLGVRTRRRGRLRQGE